MSDPMDLHARDATPADYETFVRFFEALAAGHRPPKRELWESHLHRSSFFLDMDDGETVAYAMCAPYGAHGDVRQIAVAPAWRRRGVGRQLMSAVAERLAAAGCRRWALEVREDNAPAIALYHAMGLRPERRQVVLIAGADALSALAGRADPGAVVLPAREADDAATETTLGLPRGLMARMRSLRPGVLILCLAGRGSGAAGPRGLLRWLPDVAGGLGIVHPFVARTVGDAGALLAALLARDPQSAAADVELTVEEPAVAQYLESAGAAVSERLWVMSGPLPGATT